MRPEQPLPPQLLEALLDQLAEGVLITDVQGRIVYVNPALERLTGYAREDLIGRSPRLFRSGEHPPDFYRGFWQTLLEGRVFRGFFVNRRKDGALYTEEKVVTPVKSPGGRITHFVATSRDMTQELALRRRLEELALRDPLTGLLNRRGFEEAVGRRLEGAAGHAALAYIDLDRFKEINNTYGHQWADQVLRAVAERWTAALGGRGILGRVGGDEFVAWLPGGAEGLEAARLLLSLVMNPVPLPDGEPLVVEASMGVALYPEHGARLEELLRRADLAMYQAKSLRLRSPNTFSPSLDGLTPRALAQEAELHRALAAGQALMVLQPIHDLASRRADDYELLLRLRDPAGGLVSPVPQLDLSRRSVNEAIDQFVLSESLEVAGALRGARVWVNITPWSLTDERTLLRIQELVDLGLEPHRLVLEVSEHLLAHQVGRVAAQIWRLSSVGFSFALDDFGMGNTSLSYLERLPLQYLKLDRCLTHLGSSGDAAKKRSVILRLVEMAHDLGLRVVAEGVEDAEQLAFLEHLGVDLAQGFLLGRPAPLGEFLRGPRGEGRAPGAG